MESFFVRIKEVLGNIGESVPVLIGAVILLIIGWLISILLRFLVIKFLDLIKLDTKIENTRVLSVLIKQQVKPSKILGNLVFWIFILITLILVTDIVGFRIGVSITNQLHNIIPNVIVAILVIIFGFLLAFIVEEIAYVFLENTNTPHSRIISRIIKWVTLVIVIIMALDQLGIAAKFAMSIFLISFGAVAFGLALAFGLGCKDIIRDIVIELFNSEEK